MSTISLFHSSVTLRDFFLKDDSNSESYGNSGFIVEGADIEGPAPLGLSMLFPGSINPGEENDFTNPAVISLELESRAQTFDEVTSVETVAGGLGMPESFVLLQNFPNPFNPATLIQYQISNDASGKIKTTLRIYNLLGKEVRTLVGSKAIGWILLSDLGW